MKWIPEIGPKVIPEHVEEKIVDGVVNRLPVGTRIRATLGESVLVGTVRDSIGNFPIVEIRVDQAEPDRARAHLLDLNLWVDSGWQFEILEADDD